MDDLLKVLYIVGIVVYFIFKNFKKLPFIKSDSTSQAVPKKPLPHTTPSKSFADAPPPKKATSTVEESMRKLNKEINKSKATIKTEKHIHSKVYQSKDKDARESTEVTSPRNIQDHFDKIQGYNEIKDYETGYKGDEIVFDYPATNNEELNPYAQLLREEGGAMKAVILKEILDRKY